jgi:hypothetical protein
MGQYVCFVVVYAALNSRVSDENGKSFEGSSCGKIKVLS